MEKRTHLLITSDRDNNPRATPADMLHSVMDVACVVCVKQSIIGHHCESDEMVDKNLISRNVTSNESPATSPQ